MNKDKARGEIRSFDQSSAFFLRRGDARLEEGDVLEALGLYAKATEHEPSNTAAWFRLAETYADIGCYDLSNRALLSMTWRCEGVPTLFFYRLGCNYVFLQMYEIALECFRRYTQSLEEIGETPESEEIAELLSAIELATPEGLFPDGDAVENGARIFAHHGERLLQGGDIEEAIVQLARAHSMAPNVPEVSIALAVAYWVKQRYALARELCEGVLGTDPGYSKAHCLMAMIAHSTGDDMLLARSIEALSQIDTNSIADTFQAAVTLGEVGAHAAATPLLKRCLFEDPYNISMMHASAANAYALRDAAIANDYWSKLRRLLPDDVIAAYYDLLGREAKTGIWKRNVPPYAFALPYKETKKMSAMLKRLSRNPSDETTDPKRAARIKDAILWALHHGSDVDQKRALELVVGSVPEMAETLLRDYLLGESASDENKDIALKELHALGIDGPFLAMMSDGLMEVSVWNHGNWSALPASYGMVAEIMIDICTAFDESEIAVEGLDIWQQYVTELKKIGDFPEIRKPENYAAALAYAVKRARGIRCTQKDTAAAFHATVSGLARAFDAILDVLADLFEED